MKRKISALVAGLLLIGNVAMAKIPADEGSIGGIGLGNSYDYVTEIYGTPDEDSGVHFVVAGSVYAKNIKYGRTVEITVGARTPDGPFTVMDMHISGDNGFATPRGIHVGSTKKDVYRAYGQPRKVFKNEKAKTELWSYFVEDSGPMGFTFDGRVVKRIDFGWMC
nr:MAG TPA: protein of unknown function (DUF3862) [Caudoviricetes sp.]